MFTGLRHGAIWRLGTVEFDRVILFAMSVSRPVVVAGLTTRRLAKARPARARTHLVPKYGPMPA